MASISFNIVDKQHARLLQHIADAWDLRQTVQVPYAVWSDAIVGAGQDVIDESETAAHRALDEMIRHRLAVRRGITWWQSTVEYLSEVEMAEIDWSRMQLLDRATLRSQTEQVVAANPPTVQFVVLAEALVLPPFEDER